MGLLDLLHRGSDPSMIAPELSEGVDPTSAAFQAQFQSPPTAEQQAFVPPGPVPTPPFNHGATSEQIAMAQGQGDEFAGMAAGFAGENPGATQLPGMGLIMPAGFGVNESQLSPEAIRALIGKDFQGKDVEPGELTKQMTGAKVNPLHNPLTGAPVNDPAANPIEDALETGERQMGAGFGASLGKMLGLGVDFTKEVGGILGDSITPSGQISISSLLNLGGKRDKMREARDLQHRAQVASVEAAELSVRDGSAEQEARQAAEASRPEVIAQIQEQQRQLGIQSNLKALSGRTTQQLQDISTNNQRAIVAASARKEKDKLVAKRAKLRQKQSRAAEDRRVATRASFTAQRNFLDSQKKVELTTKESRYNAAENKLVDVDVTKIVPRVLTQSDFEKADVVRDNAYRAALKKKQTNARQAIMRGPGTERQKRQDGRHAKAVTDKLARYPGASESQAIMSVSFENNPEGMVDFSDLANVGPQSPDTIHNAVVDWIEEAIGIIPITDGLEEALTGQKNSEAAIVTMLSTAGIPDSQLTAAKDRVIREIRRRGM